MPAMSPSPSVNPSPSRLRRHAATFVLMVACLGTVATSRPRSPPTTAEQTGPTVRLTQDAPRSTRRFVVRVSARDSSEVAEGRVEAALTARWKPADATAAPGLTLRSRLARVDDTDEPSRTVPLDTPDAPREAYTGSVYLDGCELKQGCEVEVELDLEAVGALGTGTVEVDWTLQAEAFTFTNEAPRGFTVQILEP